MVKRESQKSTSAIILERSEYNLFIINNKNN
jgi:hypothetical protein